MHQEKERQGVAVAEKEEGELWPFAGYDKVLPIAVWWLLRGSISSQGPKGQRWSAWLLACSLGTWWSAECVVSPCQQKWSPRKSSWSACQLLQRLEPGDCVRWGVQRGCCPARCEHQRPFWVSSKAFRSFITEKTHPCPLGRKAFLVSHTCRADRNCGIFYWWSGCIDAKAEKILVNGSCPIYSSFWCLQTGTFEENQLGQWFTNCSQLAQHSALRCLIGLYIFHCGCYPHIFDRYKALSLTYGFRVSGA